MLDCQNNERSVVMLLQNKKIKSLLNVIGFAHFIKRNIYEPSKKTQVIRQLKNI